MHPAFSHPTWRPHSGLAPWLRALVLILLPDPHDSLLQIVFQIAPSQTSPEWRCFILFRVPSLLCLFCWLFFFFPCSYNHLTHHIFRCGLSRWFSGKESTCKCRRLERLRFSPWVRKIPWSRKWQPAPIFLLRTFHGQRSLGGCSPRGRKGLDPTERTQCTVYVRLFHGFFSWDGSSLQATAWFSSALCPQCLE